MPDIYPYALAAARFFGMMNLISGVALIVASVPVAIAGGLTRDPFPPQEVVFGLSGYLLDYGFVTATIGLAILLLGKWIARFASRANKQSQNAEYGR